MPNSASNQVVEPAQAPAKASRLLLVEDERRVAESVLELLDLYGYKAEAASGGRIALERLEHDTFDVVMLDLNLIDRDGMDVLDAIVASYPDVAVIAVSGGMVGNKRHTALKRGAVDYLGKPYAAEELISAIEGAASKRRRQTTGSAAEVHLMESERLHRYMVENSPDVMYTLDAEGRFTFINQRVETLLGYHRSELLGKHYGVLVHEDDLALSECHFNERRTGDRAAHNIELRLKCRDGRRRRAHQKYLPVEISARGMYEFGEASAKRRFKGTAGIARDISDRKRAEEITHFQASHDLLTRLPNRFLFKDRLMLAISQARRNPQSMAIMFLDLDRFKRVNDTLGHPVGDELLQNVSKAVFGCLREGDTLARAGGDEFLLLLPTAGDRADAEKVADKILAVLREPFSIAENELFVSASIGIALYPEHGENPDTLIRRADVAMYEAKYRGKDTYAIYSEDLSAPADACLTADNDIRSALDAEQFVVYYQPRVDIVTGEVVTVEALARWNNPERGLLAPRDFIPAAEESGLIVPLGESVLRQACRDIAAWRNEGLAMRLAVNFSISQLEHEGVVDMILSALNEFDLPGDALEIEITENLIMKNANETISKLRKLSSQGIAVAIDDFGTGYASLGNLRRLPVDTLKLDYSFVRDIHPGASGSSITAAIASMAESLDLNLVAEGVENELQMNYLRSIGCKQMQGFMLSPPLAVDAAKEYARGVRS